MSRYRIAGCIVEYEPIFPMLRRKMEGYRIPNDEQMGKAEMVLNLTEPYLRMRNKENPVISFAQCEYICAGIQFYEKLLGHGGFLLHASAIEYKGEAYVFTAPSGTGKSTHADLWKKYFGEKQVRILNDDKPAICIEAGKIMVYGTPFSGKTDLNFNGCAPLKSVCILKQGKENQIQKIAPNEAVPFLLSQTILPENEPAFDALFEMLNSLLKKIPVYQMQCNISEEAVRMAYETMKGECQ